MANESIGAIKIVGYLEKKGKMKVVTTWKKYWFVLEGRLLLYYRSQEEYLRLSPCKGSINMGLVTDIRPGLAAIGVFQIITRTSTVTLRAKERVTQEKWLQALLDATGQQSVSSPVKMSHFRYSMDDLTPTSGKKILMRQNTLPNRFKKINRRNSIISKIRQIGGQPYMGSVDTINRLSGIRIQKEDLMENISAKVTDKTEDNKCNYCCENNNVKKTESKNQEEITLQNDLYLSSRELEKQNSKTKWFDDIQKDSGDENQNGIVLKNDLYLSVEDTKEARKKVGKKKVMNEKSNSENNEQVIKSGEKEKEVLQQNDLYSTARKTEKSNGDIILKNDLYCTAKEIENEKGIILHNDLYSTTQKLEQGQKPKECDDSIVLTNDIYIPTQQFSEHSESSKHTNKTNEIMIENAQYLPSPEFNQKQLECCDNLDVSKSNSCSSIQNCSCTESSNTSPNNEAEDDAEYYCTYEDFQSNFQAKSYPPHIAEPDLPPRKERLKSEEESCELCNPKDKIKPTRLQKLKQKFSTRGKGNNEEKKKKTKYSLIDRIRKKKTKETSEPIYDSIDYTQPELKVRKINKTIAQSEDQEKLIRTLVELQHKLEEKKLLIKQEIIQHTSPVASPKFGRNVKETTDIKEEVKDDCVEDEHPPGLPPRRNSKIRTSTESNSSKNALLQTENINFKEHLNNKNYSIDKILDDLKQLEIKESQEEKTDEEELTVKKLIEKFNHVIEANTAARLDTSLTDVSLRKKDNDQEYNEDTFNINIANRHSDELNKLLQELTKVTCAPLLTPGQTSSLQIKSDGLTDEEWLAITPIRRRRYSEPDYDVPRPHRSLQILPRSPDKEDDTNDIVIPATRFFGPVLPPNNENRKSTETTVPWRSMTPDSLEPFHTLSIKNVDNQEISAHSDTPKEKILETSHQKSEKIISNEGNCTCTNDITNDLNNYHHTINIKDTKMRLNENLFDSLEPLVEVSTVF